MIADIPSGGGEIPDGVAEIRNTIDRHRHLTQAYLHMHLKGAWHAHHLSVIPV